MPDKLSILFIHDAASVCETLANEAVKNGDNVKLVLSPKGLTTYPSLSSRVRTTKEGRVDVLESYAKSLAREEYDIAVASSRWAWVLGGAAKRLGGKKLVVVLHGSDIRRLPTLSRAKKALFTRSLKAADYLYYASPDTREAAEELGVPCAPLPFPIDREVFSPRGPAEQLDGAPSVFVPTRFDVDKGGDALTELCRKVLVDFGGSKLFVVAWSKAKEGTMTLFDEAPGGRIVSLGFMKRTELPRYYRGAGVLIGQARLGFGSMTELECLSCGTPAVFYDRYYGYGVPDPGVDALFDFFRRLVSDVKFREEKVEQGLDMINKVHDARKVYASFKEQLLKIS
jgi:glycosyltransferase involved in cell wall biosynthesis